MMSSSCLWHSCCIAKVIAVRIQKHMHGSSVTAEGTVLCRYRALTKLREYLAGLSEDDIA